MTWNFVLLLDANASVLYQMSGVFVGLYTCSCNKIISLRNGESFTLMQNGLRRTLFLSD